MKNILFSIIIPVYKVEKYLNSCVDSVLNQTFKDFELILVDDGSPDKCPEICDEYASLDERVKVIHKLNGGLSTARNSGIAIAGGEYIIFLDSDDYFINNEVLQKIAYRAIEKPDIIAYKFQEWVEKSNTFTPCYFSFNVRTKGKSLNEILNGLIDIDAYFNSAWSKAVKLSLLKNNNIKFEPGLLGEDNDWYYNVVLNANSIELIDEVFYIYRRREGSITKTAARKNLSDMLYIIKKWSKVLEKDVDNPNSIVVRNSLAKQYCSAIIIYSGLYDVSDLYFDLRNFEHYLNYSNNRRVVLFRNIKKVVGLKGLIYGISLYRKIR